MKQIAMLRLKFEDRWTLLADDADRAAEDDDWRRWISRFESLLIDTFEDVFDDAKRNLEPQPLEFAHKTIRDWCVAANKTHGRILFEVENHIFWEDFLDELRPDAEISPSDMIYIYRPQTTLCLETIGGLPPRSPDIRRVLSEIHPYLTNAMENILAQEGCGTLQEAVESFPVLRGLKESELQRFRGNSSVTAITASVDLLCPRLTIEENTVGRYFRPKPFSPR